VVSVTSEVSANVSFQGASARSARSESEQSAGNDSFAALVDSNAAAANADKRSLDASAAQTPAPRRADDSPGTPDNRSRDNTAASDQAASAKATSDKAVRNDSSDRDGAISSRSDADANSGSETARSSKSKSASSKSDAAKSDEAKPESTSAAADADAVTGQTQTTQDGTAEATANAIAAVIPITNATAETSAAAPAPDKAAAPLAIAAAAIAATASLGSTAAAPAATGTDPAATATATTTVNAARSSGAKADPQATVSEAVTAQVASNEATVTTGIAQAASAAASTPGTAKGATQVKTAVVAKEVAATSSEQDSTTTAATTTTPATTVPAIKPQAEVAGRPKAEGDVEATKADVAGTSAPTSPSHAIGTGHAATAEASQTLVNAPDSSLQAAGAIQAQQPAAPSTTQALAPQLNVTAATAQTAVPLSGLAMEIVATAKSGKSRFEIRLDPADLGRIDVRIDVDRNGQVTSHLTVERPETLSMLRQDANQLQRALDNAGLSTGNSGLQFSLRDQSSQGRNDNSQSNPNAHRLIVAEEDTIPPAVAGRSYGRMLGSSGGVDIRV
jgi:flagellar hook-length control protein FliK